MHHPISFRCRQCGHLHHAAHAGECEHPHACSVCGAGVVHSPTAKRIAAELCKPDLTVAQRMALAAELSAASVGGDTKTIVPDNWEILHDATDERLAELGIERRHVEKHTPTPKGAQTRPPQHFVAIAGEATKTKDKAVQKA